MCFRLKILLLELFIITGLLEPDELELRVLAFTDFGDDEDDFVLEELPVPGLLEVDGFFDTAGFERTAAGAGRLGCVLEVEAAGGVCLETDLDRALEAALERGLLDERVDLAGGEDDLEDDDLTDD